MRLHQLIGSPSKEVDFLRLTWLDLIFRSSYQIGKTPLLPIFAASLGASDVFLGLIVSVSTLTGIVLKPIVGYLSDRTGRKPWLYVSAAVFILMPFSYSLVDSPNSLLVVRLVHGLATAILGPVSLAYIADANYKNLAQRFAWFGVAREVGYVLGPAIAGFLLLFFSPEVVFMCIGALSLLALWPLVMLAEPERTSYNSRGYVAAFRRVGARASVWLNGLLTALNHVLLYALKTFLPIYALAAGLNIAVVGLFFSIQEASDILLRPFLGVIADRFGYLLSLAIGMLLLALMVMLAVLQQQQITLLATAIGIGAAQALIFPALLALVAQDVDSEHKALGLGVVGALSNSGKVLGPLLAGWGISQLGYQTSFVLLASILFLLGLSIMLFRPTQRLQK